MEPAKTIIEYLGGARTVASIVNKHPSRVYRWTYPLEKREGCGGIIPLRDQRRILEFCDHHGIDLVRDDFFIKDRIAAILAVRNCNSPAGSSAGEAGASSPPANPSGAPTISEQGRAEVAHRVHTPEVAGSNPVPATSFNSSGFSSPPDENAGAHGLRDARCAPAEISGEATE